MDKIKKEIVRQAAKNFIHSVGLLHDEELKYVYSKANIYVFPSLLEGFGLPGLDAMNFDLPVVCSDIPVLQEVYGPAASYFDPKNEKDITRKIIAVVKNNSLRQKLILAGRKQVKKYSWEKMARETLVIYESLEIRD